MVELHTSFCNMNTKRYATSVECFSLFLFNPFPSSAVDDDDASLESS